MSIRPPYFDKVEQMEIFYSNFKNENEFKYFKLPIIKFFYYEMNDIFNLYCQKHSIEGRKTMSKAEDTKILFKNLKIHLKNNFKEWKENQNPSSAF